MPRKCRSLGVVGVPKGSSQVDLRGRVALIAGLSGGLGGPIAARLAGAGAAVLVADANRHQAEEAVDRICASGGRAAAFAGDVSQVPIAVEAVQRTLAEFGALHIAINAIDDPAAGPLVEITPADWHRVVDPNLKSCYSLLRPAVQQMIGQGQGWGRVLTISSRAALGMPRQALYAMAKAGVVGFTKALALEVGRFGITANVVSPYYVDTPLLRARDPGAVERGTRTTAVRRLGTAGDVAAAVAFLVSEEAGFITGQVLSVCGGSNIGSLQW
jgi:NAD(P)-dependent dehydrogenase (short-subunit alcohol dehydrogenase family)